MRWIDSHPRLCLVALAMFTVACFAPVFENDFVDLDDRRYVFENAAVRTFDLGSLLTEPYLKNYHPLTMLSLATDYALFGKNPLAFHLVNLLLHILNSLLVVLILWRLLPQVRTVGFAVGALFAIHPLHVESVAWVAERKDVLCALFFLLSLLAYLKYVDSKKWLLYFASLALFSLAILSKSMAVTLPVVLLLVDYRARRKLERLVVLEKLPFLALALVIGVVTVQVQRTEAIVSVASLGITDLGSNTLNSLTFYLSKSIFPVKLSVMYLKDAVSIALGEYIFAACMAVALGASLFTLKKQSREILFGILFFFVTISIVVGIIPFSRDQVFADRYFYIPSIGLFYAYVMICYAFLQVTPQNLRKHADRGLLVFAVVAVVTYGALAFERTKVWKNTETLLTDVVAKYPDTARAHLNLGVYWLKNKQTDRAVAAFEKSVELRPDLAKGHVNLAIVYRSQNRHDEALASYERAIEADPHHYQAHSDLGMMYKLRFDPEKAEYHFKKALEIHPTYHIALTNLGALYMEQGQLDRALTQLRLAIEANPAYGRAFYYMADVLYRNQQYEPAIEYLNQAVQKGYRPPKAFVDRLMRYKSAD